MNAAFLYYYYYYMFMNTDEVRVLSSPSNTETQRAHAEGIRNISISVSHFWNFFPH